MNDKTIAEIIGWESIGDPLAPDGWITHDGRRVDEVTPNRPDADDMLAWLQQQGHDVTFQSYRKYGDVILTVRTRPNDDALIAPTLHAALEAAVRAVHDAEEAQ